MWLCGQSRYCYRLLWSLVIHLKLSWVKPNLTDIYPSCWEICDADEMRIFWMDYCCQWYQYLILVWVLNVCWYTRAILWLLSINLFHTAAVTLFSTSNLVTFAIGEKNVVVRNANMSSYILAFLMNGRFTKRCCSARALIAKTGKALPFCAIYVTFPAAGIPANIFCCPFCPFLLAEPCSGLLKWWKWKQ